MAIQRSVKTDPLAQIKARKASESAVREARLMRARENSASKKKTVRNRIGAGVAAVLGLVSLGFGVKTLVRRK